MSGNDNQTQQARRDLDRLTEQSEKLLGAGDHRAADDDAHEPAVIWGKRIGRGLGIAAVAWLAWHLITTYIIQT